MGTFWKRVVTAAIVAAGFCVALLGAGPGRADESPVRAVVSIPPLRSLVEGCIKAGPARWSRGAVVETLIPPGASEHNFEIPPSKMASLAKANLVVYVGLGMEPQVEKFLRDYPREGRRVVCFADVAGVQADADDGHHHHQDHDHDHGHEHCHDHGSTDPHLWLDPALVERLIDALGRSLGEGLTGEEAAAWERAIEERKAEVRRIDSLYRERLASAKRRTIVVGHDAWGRLAERYGLKTVAIKGLNASEPTPAAIQAAIDAVKREGLTTVFVEPQLSQAAGRRIAQATGAKVAVLDPLGDGDWAKMMESNLEALAAALCD